MRLVYRAPPGKKYWDELPEGDPLRERAYALDKAGPSHAGWGRPCVPWFSDSCPQCVALWKQAGSDLGVLVVHPDDPHKNRLTLTAETIEPRTPKEGSAMADEREPEDKKPKRKRGDFTKIVEGDQLTLPKGMGYSAAIEVLRRQAEQENEVVAVSEEVRAFPLDACHALMAVLKDRYGWTSLVPTPGFFGDKPPSMIGVEVAVGQTVQVPWGRIVLPGIEGFLQTSVSQDENGRAVFSLAGQVKRKHEKEIARIAEAVRAYLKTGSIYRGQAIRIRFQDDDGDPIPLPTPRFLDLSRVHPEELTLPRSIERQVAVNVFAPIENTAICRQYQVPLKRGVLLAGPYGTGKTLTAYVTAAKAQAAGWTFLMLENVRELAPALRFLRDYTPAVLFAEDLDRIMADGERTTAIDTVLNTVDGLDSKGTEIMVVFTSNAPETIHPAMLRPGRLDSVILFEPPDSEAVERLIRVYARGLLAESIDLTRTAQLLAGQIPALIREAVERAKLTAILSRPEAAGTLTLQSEDLELAAEGLRVQHQLLVRPERETPHPVEVVGRLVGDFLSKRIEALQATNGEED